MIKCALGNTEYCIFVDWQAHVPEEFQHLTEAQWQAKARRGDGIPYTRPLGSRSRAKYKKSDVSAFFRLKWGVLFPEALQSLIDADFPEPPRIQKKRKTRK
jgi:hypothetical protein